MVAFWQHQKKPLRRNQFDRARGDPDFHDTSSHGPDNPISRLASFGPGDTMHMLDGFFSLFFFLLFFLSFLFPLSVFVPLLFFGN